MKVLAQLFDSFSIQALTALAVTSLAAIGWSADAARHSSTPPAVAAVQEPASEYRSDDDYAELIERLELGMQALKELGRRDALESLERIANEVRAERKRASAERELPAAEGNLESRAHRLEILRLARAAHAELGHEEAVAYFDRLLHLGELQEKGASAEEIARALEGLDLGRKVELLRAAAEQYREWGKLERAEACAALAEFYTGGETRPRELVRPDPERAAPVEVDAGRRTVRALHMAEEVFRASRRADSADLAHDAYRALEVRLEGRDDAEARALVERMPPLAHRVELLAHASALLKEHGDLEGAEIVGRAAAEARSSWEREEGRPAGEIAERVEQLGRQVQELGRALDELKTALDDVRSRLR